MTTRFTDKKGREWDLQLDLLVARRVDNSDFSEFGFGVGDTPKFSILRPERLVLQRLISEAPFLFAIIWVMVQEQAEAKWLSYGESLGAFSNSRGVTHNEATDIIIARGKLPPDWKPPDDSFPISPKEKPAEAELEFISGINGPVIEAARQAMIEALGDFFPDLRTVLSVLLRQTKSLAEKAAKKLEETEPLLSQMMDEEMDKNVEEFRKSLQESRTPNGKLGTPSTASLPPRATASQTSGNEG